MKRAYKIGGMTRRMPWPQLTPMKLMKVERNGVFSDPHRL